MNLSNYLKTKKLSVSTCGEINLVYNKIDRKYYVMKTKNIKNLEKEMKEIKILEKLKSKYIIELKDYIVIDDKIHLLLNHYPKGDLYKWMNEEKNLGEDSMLKLFYKILKAIKYLHSKKIIHRDIKPENILLDKNNNPILIDFGFSSDDIDNLRKTFCGTFEYMAPEIILGNDQEKFTDIWSLGILLYEIFYGKTPFIGKNYSEIRKKILKKDPIIDNNKINYKINSLILRLLRKNPKNRLDINEIVNNELFLKFKKNKTNNIQKSRKVNMVEKNERNLKPNINNFWNFKNKIFKNNLEIKKVCKWGSFKTKETDISLKNNLNKKLLYLNNRRKIEKSILNPSKDKKYYRNVSLYSKLNSYQKFKINFMSNQNDIKKKDLKLNNLESNMYKKNNILQFKFKSSLLIK